MDAAAAHVALGVRYLRDAPHLFGAFGSNINNLTENCNPGPYSFGADFRSTLCKIYRCSEEDL